MQREPGPKLYGPVIKESFYHTHRGIEFYADHLGSPKQQIIDERPEDPMDIDSPPPPSKVHWSPREDDARPVSADSGPVSTKKGQPSLAKRIQQLTVAYYSPERYHEYSPPLPLPHFSSPIGDVAQRRKLSPVSPRHQTQPRAPRPEELYPELQDPSVRKRSFITSQETEPVIEPPTPTRARRIGGMVVGIMTTYIGALITSVWSRIWRTQNQSSARAPRVPLEIVAIETSPNSGKRRAVAAQDVEVDLTPPPSPGVGHLALPGYYPVVPSSSPVRRASPSQQPPQSATAMATPPDSRPSSREGEPTMTTTIPSEAQKPCPQAPTVAVKQQNTTESVYPFKSTPPRKSEYLKWKHDPLFIELRKQMKAKSARQQEEARRSAQRDKDVADLVKKAKHVSIESPEQKAVRDSIKTQKRRYADKKLAKIEEQERKLAEEAARLKAEEEVRLQKEQEERERIAEEARKKAEEEARRAKELAEALEAKRIAEEKALKAAQAAARPLIPALGAELEQRVEDIMAMTDGSKTVATTTTGTELSRYDLGRILPQPHERQLKNMPKDALRGPGAWLNDEAINGFLAAIVSRKLDQIGYVKRADTVPAYVAYDTNWYPTQKRQGMKGISRWSKRKHITGEKLLQCEKIFFPCSTGAHWTLLVICPKERKIEFLDSAGGKRSPWFEIARSWLKMELGEKYNDSEWVDGGAHSQMQANLDDCGVFTCLNALASATEGKGYEHVTMTSARKFIVAVLINGGFSEEWEL